MQKYDGDERLPFHQTHSGLLVVQSSLIIASIFLIGLSLGQPEICVFGIDDDHPNGRSGVCDFEAVVSFVSLLVSVVVLVYLRVSAKASKDFRLNPEFHFRSYLTCFLMTCLWLLAALIVSGYLDVSCEGVTRCLDMTGYYIGGWIVAGSWVCVALWSFAFMVYAWSNRKANEQAKAKREAEFNETATWTVASVNSALVPSAKAGQFRPAEETITLHCNDPNPFTLVVHGVNEDGDADVPFCARVTIDGQVISTKHYSVVISALKKAIIPHQEDVSGVERVIQILERGVADEANGFDDDRLEMDRRLQLMDRQQRDDDEFKHSGPGAEEQERLRRQLLETQRQNELLQRELEERKAAERRELENAHGRQRAQSEQEREASRLLQQMVELEAQQQKQHAAQIAALERQIQQLKRGRPDDEETR